MTGSGDSSDMCRYGKPYAEYVKGTKYERLLQLLPDYNPVICCHKDAPFVVFQGGADNYKCESAKGSDKCPLYNKKKKSE